MRSRKNVCCTPGTAADGVTYLEMPWMALSTALCGSEPMLRLTAAFCSCSTASRTCASACASEPGEPVGAPTGEAPIGTRPVNAGGRLGGGMITHAAEVQKVSLLPAPAAVLASTSHG